MSSYTPKFVKAIMVSPFTTIGNVNCGQGYGVLLEGGFYVSRTVRDAIAFEFAQAFSATWMDRMF